MWSCAAPQHQHVTSYQPRVCILPLSNGHAGVAVGAITRVRTSCASLLKTSKAEVKPLNKRYSLIAASTKGSMSMTLCLQAEVH